MFNIGATYAQLAVAEGVSTVEGLKRACHYLMCAAGVFIAMPTLTSVLQLPPGTDVLECITSVLGQFMLAQAQECFVLKAIMDRSVKDTTMARLAFSTATFYETTLNQAKNLTKVTPLFVDHLDIMAGKVILYKAMAHYRKSSEFLISLQYGREIAKLQQADEVLKQAKDFFKKLSSTDFAQQINALGVAITKNLERALKDNTIIYNDPIPAPGAWGDCGTAVVVNPVAFPEAALQTATQDEFIFARLPELQLSRFVERVYDARNNLINEISSRLDVSLGALDALFVSLELPGRIQAIIEPEGVPQATFDLSLSVQAKGGYQAIEEAKQACQTQREQCLVLLELIRKTLNEEEVLDEQARKQYPKTWKRPASSKLNSAMKARFKELQKYFDQGATSDMSVTKLFEKHITSIITLCYSPQELVQAIPSAANTTPTAISALVHEINASLGRKMEFVQAKERLLGEMCEKVQSYDVVSKMYEVKDLADPVGVVVGAINQVISGELSESVALESEMADYSRLLERQMAEFSQYQLPVRMMELSNRRHEVLQQLYEASEAFKVLQKQLKEGLDFYTNLSDHLAKLHKSVMEYDRDRRDEHDRLVGSMATTTPAVAPVTGATAVAPSSPSNPMPPMGYPGAWNPNVPVQYATQGYHPQPPAGMQPSYYAPPLQGYPSAGYPVNCAPGQYGMMPQPPFMPQPPHQPQYPPQHPPSQAPPGNYYQSPYSQYPSQH